MVATGFSFAEIDSDIVVDLLNSNEEYAALSEQMSVMRKQHPFILNLDEGDGAITLSAEEHEAYLAYIGLMHQTEDRSTLTATGFKPTERSRSAKSTRPQNEHRQTPPKKRVRKSKER